MESIHSVARGKILHTGFRIIRVSDRQDVIYPGGYYDAEQSLPIYIPGVFDSTGRNLVFLGYPELLAMGYVIVARDIKEKWFKMQRYAYFIVSAKMAALEKVVTQLPDKHEIELNRTENTVRLVGKSAGRGGFGPWIEVN